MKYRNKERKENEGRTTSVGLITKMGTTYVTVTGKFTASHPTLKAL